MLTHLFRPIKVGRTTLRNRIMSDGHAPGFAVDGLPTGRYRAYHVEKAKGGVGLTIMGGSTSVAPNSPASGFHLIANHDDSIIPHYRELVDAVHAHGAAIMSQLGHYGRHAHSDTDRWLPLVAPSQAPGSYRREVPHALDEREIRAIVVAFGQAARRCRDAGFDGVELSATHNHLIDQFWSPRSNLRRDRYGGSLDHRMRFSLEVLEEIRRVVGDTLTVGVRMSGDEGLEGGLGPTEARAIAARLAASGALDFLSVIGGSAENPLSLAELMPSMRVPSEPFVGLARAIKEVVDLPVLHSGRVLDPETADRVIAEGSVDVVGMTRALIADPQLPEKVRAGSLGEIRPCVLANQCIDRLYAGKDMVCIHNVVTGRERELGVLPPARRSVRVVVVGAGPAGLEAARVSALRGHDVVLIERSDAAGGQVTLSAQAPGRSMMRGIITWLERAVRAAGAELRLGAEATPQAVADAEPDVVIVATGARPSRPDRPGFDGPNVVQAWDVLRGHVSAGRRVLVIDEEGSVVGPGAAELLAAQGSDVEIVTTLPRIGPELGVTTYPLVYRALFEAGVGMTPHHAVPAIDGATVHLRNVYTGAERLSGPVDTVVLAFHHLSVDALAHELADARVDVRLVGDAMSPRGVHNAMLDARRAADAVELPAGADDAPASLTAKSM